MEVQRVANPAAQKSATVSAVRREPGGTAVVTGTRILADELTRMLREVGIPAGAFHQGMLGPDRDRVKTTFQTGKLRALLVPELAFARLERRDLRQIVHLGLPASLAAFAEELEPGGRDGKPFTALIVFSDEDIAARRAAIEARYPAVDAVRILYRSLAALDGQETSLEAIADQLHGQLALPALAGAFDYLRRERFVDPKGAVGGRFTVRMLRRDEPYPREVADEQARLLKREQSALDEVLRYVTGTECRWTAFTGGPACNRCDVCRKASQPAPAAKTAVPGPTAAAAPTAKPASTVVSRASIPDASHEGAFNRRRVQCPYCGGKVVADELVTHCNVKHRKDPPEGYAG